MPLDSNFGDHIFYSRVDWKHKFSFLPHRCQLSGRIIWLELAIRGTATYHGPGTPVIEQVIEHRWRDSAEHLIWLLKK